MSRHLVHPDQPWPVRVLLYVYQFSASLKLAVILILWLAITLGVGTFVEAAYGTPVAQFGVYRTWWFNVLLVLLAVNIFCAASIRFPWKRHQTGFVITHIGLLTLISGTALSRLYGIDAQIFVYERQANAWALEDEHMHFDMVVHNDGGESETARDAVRPVSASSAGVAIEPLDPVSFQPGPFSWEDYGQIFTLSRAGDDDDASLSSRLWRNFCGWMFSAAGRDRAGRVLYDQGGILLEVLDFFADSRKVNAPQITVAMSTPRGDRLDASGRTVKSRYHWMQQTLDIVEIPRGNDYPFGVSDKAQFPGGTVSFAMTDVAQQRDAFLANKPQGPLGERGQVVLFIDGKPRRFDVAKQLGAGPQPISGTKWQAEISDYWPAAQPAFNDAAGRFEAKGSPSEKESISPAVQVKLTHAGQDAGRLVLFADQPNLSIQNYEHNIFGDYWFDHLTKSQQQRMMFGIGNRIDILQSPADGGGFELHYRRWQLTEKVQRLNDKTTKFVKQMSVVASGKLPAAGTPETAVDAFTMADQLKFFVQEHVAGDKPEAVTLPVAFQKDKNVGVRRPAAKLRLTVDGKSDTFWLAVYKGDPDFTPTGDSLTHTVQGKNRSVSITLPMKAVDIGFRVQLENFERRLDPGTSQPSHYSSTVEFLERHADRAIMHAALDGANPTHFKPPDVSRKANDYFTASSIALTDDVEWLYWIDGQRRIQRISRTESDAEPQTIVGSPHSPAAPVAIAIDDKHEQLYWVEYNSRGISGAVRRADLDGENDATITSFAGRPTGLALDVVAETIFWSSRQPSRAGETETGAIGRVDFSGENANPSLVAQMGVPSSIAVNPDDEHIYWTEPARGSLRRVNYDGSGVRRISLDGKQTPTSVAVDAENERIFWADAKDPPERADEEKAVERLETHRIWTADLDGEDSRIFAGERVRAPQSLLVDAAGKRLWWTQDAVLRDDVWITMNAPVEFANPRTRQSYRLFQESFVGPFKPGSAEYEELVPNSVNVAELYASVLTVNYDPGRWIRNIGCLLIVCGIATMFYMRAYFFRPVRRAETPAAAEREDRPTPANPPAPPEKQGKKQVPAKVMT